MYMLLHVNYTCNQTEFMAAGFRCRFDREARMGNDRLNSQSNSVKDAGLIFKGLQTQFCEKKPSPGLVIAIPVATIRK